MKNLNSRGVSDIFQRTNRKQAEKEQQPGGWRDLSSVNTKNEEHLVGFRTIIWRVYWTYVRLKLLAKILAGSISRLLLPVDYYCQYILSQCPALVKRLRAVLDAPRHNASWEACRFRGGPGYGSNVCPQPVGYYSSTAAVYEYTAVVPVFLTS